MQKGARIHEFFKDFDKLRKGQVTPQIFERVLVSNLRLTLQQGELAELLHKYKD